jgi:hypothetical protein
MQHPGVSIVTGTKKEFDALHAAFIAKCYQDKIYDQQLWYNIKDSDSDDLYITYFINGNSFISLDCAASIKGTVYHHPVPIYVPEKLSLHLANIHADTMINLSSAAIFDELHLTNCSASVLQLLRVDIPCEQKNCNFSHVVYTT